MANISYQEQLSGNIGVVSASAFELSYEPISNTLLLFVNGVNQRVNTDFVIRDTDVYFVDAVPSAYDVRAAYVYDDTATPTVSCGDGTIYLQETLTENATVTATEFALARAPDTNSLLLFVNGVVQRPTTDFTLSDSTITFLEAVPSGQTVQADYEYTQPYEKITPTGWKGSTTLNHAITSYDMLADRIKMDLGWPSIQIEICDDNIYNAIDQAVEWYSKYAGMTEEYLLFNTAQTYKCGLGVKLDDIFSAAASWNCSPCDPNRLSPEIVKQYYDCDLNHYRKVVDVFSVDSAGSSSTDTLFSMDYLFAQQTYFSYLLGSFGWDMTTWHLLKSWLDLRKKMFATDPYFRFDPRTQYLKIIPEPKSGSNYIGVVGCRVERPIADLVKERWVQRYALALTKIALAHIRGKFGGVTLFGGASLNATDLMTQGLNEKEMLEKELMENYGEVEPILFFIG